MRRKLLKRIQNAKHQTQLFFENSYREIAQDDNDSVYGFPELSNRDRLTEWGATSSALVGLSISSDNSPKSQDIIKKSKVWLLSKQNDDGSWEASDMSLSEATAGVLLDLKKINGLVDQVVDKAVSFLKNCYNDNHYISTSDSIEKPHLYTTYIVCLCLNEVGRLDNKDKIKQWILEAETSNLRWGQIPKSNEETLIHTIFALKTLNACGMAWEEIKSNYAKQIAWIKSCDLSNFYLYEEMQFRTKKSDQYGMEYGRLRLRHFTLPIIGNFYLDIDYKPGVMIIAQRIIEQQFSGGWGPSKDELTMWATQQAIEFLDNVEKRLLPCLSNLDYIISVIKGINFYKTKLVLTFSGAALACLFLSLPNYRANFLIGIFLMVVPWLLRKE